MGIRVCHSASGTRLADSKLIFRLPDKTFLKTLSVKSMKRLFKLSEMLIYYGSGFNNFLIIC